ncbi:MAG: competence/damage-inducible protein A [Anaerolineae bacterium]
MAVAVEIIAVGNELLLGDVLDSNSHWLCRQLTGLGATVRRVTQLPDVVEVAAAEVRAALGRQTQLLLTTGGLGPTDDDRTLDAVALALGRPLVAHPLALQWIERKYAELARAGWVDAPGLTPARAKMALLPTGAEPLPNGVGSAPGMYLVLEQATLVSLPGVPDEMKDIFTRALHDRLQGLLGAGAFVEWQARVACGDESVLAPLLRAVAVAHPEVYVKSRAGRFGPEAAFRVTLSARGADETEALERVRQAAEALRVALDEAGIGILAVERSSFADGA